MIPAPPREATSSAIKVGSIPSFDCLVLFPIWVSQKADRQLCSKLQERATRSYCGLVGQDILTSMPETQSFTNAKARTNCDSDLQKHSFVRRKRDSFHAGRTRICFTYRSE